MKILSNSELPLWLNCNQMDIKVIISKGGILLFGKKKNRHLRHFTQNLLCVKVHTNCKISKFCQHFGATKTQMYKYFGICIFFNLERQDYRYYQERSCWDHIIFIHKSYNEIVDKIAK